MGEYFNNKKLGTDTHLMDVSRNHIINRYNEFPNEVDRKGCTLEKFLALDMNYIYRFPYEEELNKNWDDDITAEDFNFSVNPKFVEIPHDEIFQTTILGNKYNLPFCPAGKKAESLGVRKVNHNDVDITIFGETYTADNPNGFTLFKCVICGKIFCVDKKEDLYIKDLLLKSGLNYIASCIKHKND